MKASNVNQLDNFIAGWFIDAGLCDELVSHYLELESQDKQEDIKRENFGYNWVPWHYIDASLNQRYFEQVDKVVEHYIELYKWASNEQQAWRVMTPPNFQRYFPNKSYKIWHMENDGGPYSIFRHLAFMTYLNDVDNGGHTEFLYQKIKIKPEKGLTIIWPAGWTHVHRGTPAPEEEKFAITGWFNYNVYDVSKWGNPQHEIKGKL